ncbi:MAG: ornithine cyclodeaminase family protein [Streptosporangiales bacterium]
MVLFLADDEVSRLLDADVAYSAAYEAFGLLGRREATNGVRQRTVHGAATVNVMAAVAPPLEVMGVKTYPVVRTDVTQGSAFTLQLFALATGELTTVLRAGTLGNRRTAAATAVATSVLACADSKTLTVFGTGWVAREQVTATLRQLPGVEQVIAVGRSRERLTTFCTDMKEQTGRPVTPGEPEPAVRAADIIITATGSRTPVFDGSWLQPGTHVNAVGSNYAEKQEIDRTAIASAGAVIVDDLDVAHQECGDLIIGLDDWSGVAGLGDVIAGTATGRASDSQITLFESQGMAILDVTAGARVAALAREQGIGATLDTW